MQEDQNQELDLRQETPAEDASDLSLPDQPQFEDPAPAAPLPKRKIWFARHKVLTVVLVLILAAAGLVVWQLRRAADAVKAMSTYQFVRTTVLKRTSLDNSVSVSGTVNSGEKASVTVADAAKTYKVASVNVQVGDHVNEGDVIATLDTADLERQIQEAEQSYSDTLQAAQTSYDRALDDYNTSVVQHDNNLIDLQAKVDEANTSVSDAQKALDDAQSSKDSAQSNRDTLKAEYDRVQAEISSYTMAYNTAAQNENNALSALNTANLLVVEKSNNRNSAQYAVDADPSDANIAARDAAQAELDSATADQTAKQAAYDQAHAATAEAQQALSEAQNSCSVVSLGLYGFQAIEQAYNTAEQTLSQAQTALDTAQKTLDTANQQLTSAQSAYDSEKNYSTIKQKQQTLEDAETKLEQAKRTPDNLTTLRETLADCTLTATMSGTVTALNATVGSVCSGDVATIQDTDALVVEVTVPADDVPSLKTGLSCIVTSDATGSTEIPGTLTQIDPVANDKGTFGAKVKISSDNSDLLIGVQAKVEIIIQQTDNVFTVPIDAVGTAEDGSSYVLRQTGGSGVDMTFEEVPVTTGEANDYSIVISGDDLAEGDVIRSSADLTQGLESSDNTEDLGEMLTGDVSVEMEVPAEGGGPGGPGGGPADAPGGQ
ncbi:MAG: hypothetical protein DBX59_01650 [Bacillota bacterium]|nr:MAG: hypothetical protein DBX59_01650 [Bacillota bacterium]